jgi:hypothetical protein
VVRDVDQLVLSERRMQLDVHQPREALRLNVVRQSRDRRGIEHAVSHNPQSPRTFRHENRAVGQKRHAPRLIESFCRDDADGPDERGLVDHWRVGQWR